MARNFFTPINLNKLEIQNVQLHNLAAAPSAPVLGQFYYDTVLNSVYVWDGTIWVALDARKLTSIPNSALATNPLARANHTGTQTAATISDLDATIKGYRLDQFTAASANVPMGGNTLTNLGTPTAPGQAAEYSWVIGQLQAAAAGITSRPPVRVVATANSTLTGLLTIDGITLVAGDRVLATGQTAAAQNGVWVVGTGAWTRALTEDQSAEVTAGAMWLATEGTSGAGTQWRQATTGVITIGSTALSIVQFGAGAAYTQGNGISITGSTIAAVVAPSGGLTVSGAGLALDTSIATRKFTADLGDGTATNFSIFHNFNTRDIVMQVRNNTGQSVVECDMAATNLNNCNITFATAPTTNQFRVVIVG